MGLLHDCENFARVWSSTCLAGAGAAVTTTRHSSFFVSAGVSPEHTDSVNFKPPAPDTAATAACRFLLVPDFFLINSGRIFQTLDSDAAKLSQPLSWMLGILINFRFESNYIGARRSRRRQPSNLKIALLSGTKSVTSLQIERRLFYEFSYKLNSTFAQKLSYEIRLIEIQFIRPE